VKVARASELPIPLTPAWNGTYPWEALAWIVTGRSKGRKHQHVQHGSLIHTQWAHPRPSLSLQEPQRITALGVTLIYSK
jgi:hypothetical protein